MCYRLGMTSETYDMFTEAIAAWSGTPADVVARYAREADALAARAPGMHDTRVDIIVRAAFDGGDTTGDDDYGVSVAWVDLADIGDYGAIMRDFADDLPTGCMVDDAFGMSLAAYLATLHDMAGRRYALAYWDANGCRSVVGYSTRADMMAAFRVLEADYLAWLDDEDE